ncbi:unnamed protein product, partial [Amoebophrya sp. A25]
PLSPSISSTFSRSALVSCSCAVVLVASAAGPSSSLVCASPSPLRWSSRAAVPRVPFLAVLPSSTSSGSSS